MRVLAHGAPISLWDDAGGFVYEPKPTTLTVFELFSEDDTRELVVREAVWQQSADLRRLKQATEAANGVVSMAPTVAVRDGAVPASKLAELLAAATAFRVPVVWLAETLSVTSDVGAVGLEFFSEDQPPAVLRLQWSDAKPASWKPVVEWFERLRAFFEGCLSGGPGRGELLNGL